MYNSIYYKMSNEKRVILNYQYSQERASCSKSAASQSVCCRAVIKPILGHTYDNNSAASCQRV